MYKNVHLYTHLAKDIMQIYAGGKIIKDSSLHDYVMQRKQGDEKYHQALHRRPGSMEQMGTASSKNIGMTSHTAHMYTLYANTAACIHDYIIYMYNYITSHVKTNVASKTSQKHIFVAL